jgi:predicted permease
MWQDVRFAMRVMARRPAGTIVAALVLAVGVGINVGVFSVVNAAFLRPLPVRLPHELVTLYVGEEGAVEGYGNHSYPDFADLREHCADAVELCARNEGVAMHIGAEGSAIRVSGALVSGNYFSLLGVGASQGRVLTPNDDLTFGGHPVAVVSERFWRSQLGGDEAIVGRELRINGRPFDVVGVADAGFDGTVWSDAIAIWVPMCMFDVMNPGYAAMDFLHTRTISWMDVIGRMKPGFSMEQVGQHINAGYQRIAEEAPSRATMRSFVRPLGQTTIDPESRHGAVVWMRLLMMAVGVVMLIACSNVASLQLARLHGRRRELAVRLALGATRWRLSRQLLTECLLLALAAAAGGLLLAQWFGDALLRLMAREGTYSLDALHLTMDWRIAAFTIGLAMASGVLFGLAPALHAARREPLPALKSDRSGSDSASGRFSFRSVLVSGQVAMSFVLVICACLLMVSLVRLQGVNLGFDPSNVLAGSVDLGRQGMDETRGRVAYRQMLERLRAMPGVRSATLANLVPVSGGSWTSTITVPDYEPAADEQVLAHMNHVDRAYFETMRIPLLRGRLFTEADGADSPCVAIINQTMADRYWAGQDPVGRIFQTGTEDDGRFEVVGVVADSKYNTFRAESVPYSYMPIEQHYQSALTLLVRAEGDPFAILPAMQEAVHSVDAGLPLYRVRSLDQQLRDVVARERLTALLFTGFGAVALALVLAGLYGVLSQSVNQRVREIGIRMAIGAGRGDVLRLFLGQGLRLTGAGLAVGAAISFFVTRLLSGQLYQISPVDPGSMIFVALMLLGVGAAACWIPARRATRVDPMQALRSE